MRVSTTHIVVDSAPVPAVVGVAISGFIGWVGTSPRPMGGVMKSSNSPEWLVNSFTALAVSIAEPPPTATTHSQSTSRANSTASPIDLSVGSMPTWS